MPRLRALVCALAAVALAGCDFETEIEIPIPEHEPRLVVNALFQADSALTVLLAQSVGVNAPGDGVVRSARVDLFEDGRLVERLRETVTFDEFGGPYGDTIRTYRSTHRMQAGRTYRLSAEAAGLPPVEAEERLPAPPAFEVIAVERGEPTTDPNYGGRVRVDRLTIRLDDPPGPNAYALTAPARTFVPDCDPDVPGCANNGRFLYDSPFRTDEPALREGTFEDVFEGDDDLVGRVTFSDARFDGRAFTFTIEVQRFAVDPPARVEGYVRLDAVSETYHRYAQAQETASENEGNPFAEPLELPTNVEGGLGIFAGRTPRLVRLPEG